MNVFECKKCGQCCEGKGGIVLSRHDRERLAAHLSLSMQVFLDKFTEKSGGKRKLTIAGGQCVFFRAGEGCSVHVAKPDICRAWPFFKGNLLDELSFRMARDYCAGIAEDCGFEEFSAAGKKYLRENHLLDHIGPDAAEALKLPGNQQKSRSGLA